MKKILIALLGGIFGIGVSILSFYLIGILFGPISQGEDDAAKYFKVFLGVSCVLFILGSLGASKYYKSVMQKKL